jgi:hypothetical protein
MSPRILRTTQRLPLLTLQYEVQTGVDGQGKPSYDSAVDLDANVVEYDAAQFGRGEQYVIADDGSRVETPLTLYVRGDSSVVPATKARVTLADDRRFIVMEVKPVAGLMRLHTEPDHYRVRCKVE